MRLENGQIKILQCERKVPDVIFENDEKRVCTSVNGIWTIYQVNQIKHTKPIITSKVKNAGK